MIYKGHAFLINLFFLSPIHALPDTEKNNPLSSSLGNLSAVKIVHLMNSEDMNIAPAIAICLPIIAKAIENIASALKHEGRLIYLGAGSSGRLGVLDASECYPTFSAPKGQVIGIIAGGDEALRESIESSEDQEIAGIQALQNINLTSKDIVCGISASGCAQYVNKALEYAKLQGCTTILVTCTQNHPLATFVTHCIAPIIGPEILSGSTRLKAGTATKMILNMLTTGTYIILGKVYKNYMIDLKPLNKKLIARSIRILKEVLNIDNIKAEKLFIGSGKSIKIAILIHRLNIDQQSASSLLSKHQYKSIEKIIEIERALTCA